MVIFATIFFNTVLRFVNFLSFDSAAWSSARNSYGACEDLVESIVGVTRHSHLNLASLEELGILTRLTSHTGLTWSIS